MTYIRWTFPVILFFDPFQDATPYYNVPRRCFILIFLFDPSERPFPTPLSPRASYFHYSRSGIGDLVLSPLLFSLRLVTHHISRVPRPRC